MFRDLIVFNSFKNLKSGGIVKMLSYIQNGVGEHRDIEAITSPLPQEARKTGRSPGCVKRTQDRRGVYSV